MAEDAQIKGLKFNVEGETKGAIQGLESLASALNKIKSSTKGGLGLKRAMKEMQEFSKNSPSMKNVTVDFGNFISSLEKSFSAIKSATKGGLGLRRSVKEMLLFGEAIGSDDTFRQMGKATAQLDTLAKPLSNALQSLSEGTQGKIRLATFGRQIAAFAESIRGIENSDFEKITQMAGTLSAIAKPLGDAFAKLSEATQGKVTGLGTFGKQLGVFIDSVKNFSPSDLQNFSAIAQGIDKLAPSIARFRASVGDNARDIADVFRGLKDFNKAYSNWQKMQKDTSPTNALVPSKKMLTENKMGQRESGEVQGNLSEATEDAVKKSKLWSQIWTDSTKRQFISNFASVMNRAASSVGNFFKKLKTSALKAFGNALRSVGSHLKGLLPKLNLVGNAFKNLTAKIKHIGSALARIALYRFMRSLIKGITSALKEGTQNLYQYSQAMGTDFHNSLDQISTDALYLKNSFAAAVAPIVNALAPAIDMLANKIANLLNLIAQLFAALSGKGIYTKATKSQKQFADATGSAGDAVRYLIGGFDELNVLPSQSGGGGGGSDFGDMFEEAEVSSKIKEFADKLKAAIKAGDWEGVGAIFAQELNKITDQVDDWIVKKFTPKAKTWASRIGRILNGFIKEYNWEKLGKTLADGVNGVFGALETFFDTFDAKTFGRKIGSLIKSFFTNTDWKMLGRTFAKKWNTLMHTIEGIVTTPGLWESIGSAVGDFVKNWFATIDLDSLATIVINLFNGVTKSIRAFLDKKPFEGVGKKIANAINRMIHEIDWAELAKTLSDLFMELLNVLWEAANEIDWEGLGKAIGDFLGNIDWWGLLTKVADIVFKAFTGVIKGMLSTDGGRVFLALFAAIKGLKLAFTLAQPILTAASKVLAEKIIENFASIPGAIKGIGSKIGTSVKGLMGTTVTSGVGVGGVAASAGAATIAAGAGVALGMEMADIFQPGSKQQFIDAFNDTYSADSLGGNIEIWAKEWGNIFSNLWNDMVDEVTTNWEAFTQRIGIIGDWFAEIGQLIAEKFTNFTSQVGEFFTGVWLKVSTFFSNLWTDISTWFTNAISDIGNWFSTIWTDVSTWFSNTATSIGEWFSTAWNDVSTWFTTAISDIGTWFSNIWSDISTWFSNTASNIGEWFSTAWQNISTWFSTAISSIGEWFSGIWQDVSGFFSNVWSKVSGFFSDAWSSISGFFSNVFSNAGTFFSNLWTTISNWFSNTWSNISSWFSSLPQKIGEFFSNAGQWLIDAGKRIVDGLWNGISSGWEWLKEKVSGLVTGLVDGVKDLLGIESPSKVFAEIGQYSTEGWGEGLMKGKKKLLSQATDTVNAVTKKMTPTLNNTISASPSNTYTNYVDDGTEASILNVLMEMFEFMQTSGNGRENGDIKVLIDGKEVFQAVVNENNRAIRRSGGTSPLRV